MILILITLVIVPSWYARMRSALEVSPNFDRINVAAMANGGTATASSSKNDMTYPPSSIINEDRKGLGWGSGGGWADATPSQFPDSVEVEFSGVALIDEIDVFTLQDSWWSPIEPTETTSFFNNGITVFNVQYWNGSEWITVPNGSVTGNNKVWRKFIFAPVLTDKLRVVVNAAKTTISTIVELEAWGELQAPPDPSPTPTPEPSPTPEGDIAAALAQRDIFFDTNNNIGFGTTNPIFNDDGTTGAFVGKWFAIDGKSPGAAAYLGLGGTIPNPGDRVGVLNFYNLAMGGADNRTAAIYSFNGSTLGTGNLEFYTSPNFIGPVRRMQIAPTGEVGINHAAGVGTMFEVMSKTTDSSTKGLVVVDGSDRAIFTVRSDGQVSVDKAGQGLVLKSPNGLVCKKLTIDDSGNLVVAPMGSCP